MSSAVHTIPHKTAIAGLGKEPQFYVRGRPKRLRKGDYIYLCHQGRILLRARWLETVRANSRPNLDGEEQGPGVVLICAASEPAPSSLKFEGGRFRYLTRELW